MFTKSITLFRILGFEIKVDFTWIFLAILISWSLAVGFFPIQYPGLSTAMYWSMGIEGAIGLFISIALHELGHSVVARRFGIQIKDITLFIFGGVANMEGEPKKPRDEFYMAIAGPITSGILALIFFALNTAARAALGSVPLLEVLVYLAWMNSILALFNMVPAFPLDGGRVLRAILWDWKKDLRWATRISSAMGSGFGLLLIILGIFAFMSGNVLGGVWWFMIGIFVRSAAAMSYKQLLLRRALEGEPVSRFMQTEVVGVRPTVTLRNLVEEYVYQYHFKTYPVFDGPRLVGCVTTRGIKSVPKGDWDRLTVSEILEPCSEENSIGPDEDAMVALSRMNRTGRGRLMVVEGGELLGIIALKDLMEFLSLKLDLEEKAP